ncbi:MULTISPECIES: heme exporter protein CcmB [unclassified Marinimicrobium]|jgi:heme exporter protein B|uniref:heme exporter protein CcmB n=2 Tax=Marinimicrobium TaxID=359337 RepID=UPI000C4E9393|nr:MULTISPECIES: heme exporter protein CcmB [unclassified Marinimicrobium]MAN52245.1 heme exporter protein CcmB [Marinimicrobium sp.]
MSTEAGSAFVATLKRDLLLAGRHPGDWINPLVFFLIAITLVPLGVGPEAALLAVLAPGILWVMALLATLLSLDGLFRSDFDDGALEQCLVSPSLLYLTVLAKVLAHWLVTGLPLTLMSPLLGLMLALPEGGYGVLCLSLMIGTITMSLIGSVGAALTVSLRRGGLLLSLIVMPLYVPVLIFGASAVNDAALGNQVGVALAVLGTFGAMAAVLAPFAAAAALRICVDSY